MMPGISAGLPEVHCALDHNITFMIAIVINGGVGGHGVLFLVLFLCDDIEAYHFHYSLQYSYTKLVVTGECGAVCSV